MLAEVAIAIAGVVAVVEAVEGDAVRVAAVVADTMVVAVDVEDGESPLVVSR